MSEGKLVVSADKVIGEPLQRNATTASTVCLVPGTRNSPSTAVSVKYMVQTTPTSTRRTQNVRGSRNSHIVETTSGRGEVVIQ